MINLLVDIPMNDEALNPPIKMRLWCIGRVAVLNGCPDDLLQFAEADRRSD